MFEESQFNHSLSNESPEFRGHGITQDVCVGEEDFDKSSMQDCSASMHGSHTSHSSK